MNNTQGSLLYCPLCAMTSKPQVLGRITAAGNFLVLRFHQGTTLIRAEHYSLTCGCGFTYLINGTVIKGTTIMSL